MPWQIDCKDYDFSSSNGSDTFLESEFLAHASAAHTSGSKGSATSYFTQNCHQMPVPL